MSESVVDVATVRNFLVTKIIENSQGLSVSKISDDTLLVDMKLTSLKAMVILSSLKDIASVNYEHAIHRATVMRTFEDMLHNACVLCELNA